MFRLQTGFRQLRLEVQTELGACKARKHTHQATPTPTYEVQLVQTSSDPGKTTCKTLVKRNPNPFLIPLFDAELSIAIQLVFAVKGGCVCHQPAGMTTFCFSFRRVGLKAGQPAQKCLREA